MGPYSSTHSANELIQAAKQLAGDQRPSREQTHVSQDLTRLSLTAEKQAQAKSCCSLESHKGSDGEAWSASQELWEERGWKI